MANPTVNPSIPQSANLRSLLWVSDQIDQSGSNVKGAWDAKNSVYYAPFNATGLSPVALGASGLNGLLSDGVTNTGIALAATNDHTGTIWDITGPTMSVVALVRPKSNTPSVGIPIIQNYSNWSSSRGGWMFYITQDYVAGGGQLVGGLGTSIDETASALGTASLNELMLLAFTRTATGDILIYKNGTETHSGAGIQNHGTGSFVYDGPGNDRRAGLFNFAQSYNLAPLGLEIYAVGLWDVALTAAEIQSFGTTPAELVAGKFLTDSFSGLPLAAVLSTATLSGPTTGVTGTASTNFTVTLDAAATATTTVTPAGTNGTFTFTPAAPTIAIGATSTTFTATPASNGAHTMSITTTPARTFNLNPVTYTTGNGSVTTDPLETTNGGIAASVTVHWSWYPGGRIGALAAITPQEGSGTTNASGTLTVTGLVPGAGVLLTNYRQASQANDNVHYHTLTAA